MAIFTESTDLITGTHLTALARKIAPPRSYGSPRREQRAESMGYYWDTARNIKDVGVLTRTLGARFRLDEGIAIPTILYILQVNNPQGEQLSNFSRMITLPDGLRISPSTPKSEILELRDRMNELREESKKNVQEAIEVARMSRMAMARSFRVTNF